MRLKYNILWVENELDWLDSSKEFVEEIIEDNGFIPNILVKSSEIEIHNLLENDEPLKEFDLILVDFVLDKGDRGSIIIDEIRNNNIYTEVMFYSQDIQSIRLEVSNLELDGVYCSSRNRDDFEDKFERIFKVTVKKIQHISTMRGLLMSETSALDNLLIDIMLAFYEHQEIFKTGGDDILYDYKLKKIGDSFKGRDKNYQKYIEERDFIKLAKDFRLLDSIKKMYAVGKILEILKIETPVTKKAFLKEYQDEVISVRNNLAHADEMKKDGKVVLVTKGGEEEFSDERCIGIRVNLKKHFGYLEEILKAIESE